MNIKDSNKMRAQQEIAERKSKDRKGLELAHKQEAERMADPDIVAVRVPISKGYAIKYVKRVKQHTRKI